VTKAREYRTARVKEARSEAAKEIDALKAKRDQEQRDREQEGSGEADKGQEKLDKETTEQIDGLKSLFERNRDDVVKVLLDRLVEIQPEPHRNFKKEGQSS